jgi:predicted CoA-binding protein
MNEREVIRAMLGHPPAEPRTIAVVGLSDKPDRPSHYVSAYMQENGYRIIPVNQQVETVLGERVYDSLAELPEKPDVVNVFRLPKFIPGIVEEMLELGLKNIWIQQGIINMEAAQKAESGGIKVVMDRCIMVEHQRSGLS